MRGLLPARTIYYYPIYQYNWTMKKFFLSVALITEIGFLVLWLTVMLLVYILLFSLFASSPTEEPIGSNFVFFENFLFYAPFIGIYVGAIFLHVTSIIECVKLLKNKPISNLLKIFLVLSILPMLYCLYVLFN